MILKSFLKGTLEFDFQPDYIRDEGVLETEIFNILTPKRLRFKAIDYEMKTLITDSVKMSVQTDSPIKIINACGGFKNYRIDSAPNIDWAEVFHVSFLTHALQKICEIYKPGVWLEYSGDAHMACYVDNLKKEWVDTYIVQFNNLIKSFSEYVAPNFKLTTKHFLDFYNYDEVTQEIEKRIKNEDLSSFENKELISKRFDRAKSNFCFNGLIDCTNLKQEEKQELIRMSIIKTYKWYDLDFERRGDYFNSPAIPICNSQGAPGSYIMRSVGHLPAPAFWQGKGIIEMDNKEIKPKILHIDDYINVGGSLKFIDVENIFGFPENLSQIGILSI